MKKINFIKFSASCKCPKCGEWENIYDIGDDNYECGACGKKFKF